MASNDEVTKEEYDLWDKRKYHDYESSNENFGKFSILFIGPLQKKKLKMMEYGI